MVDWVAFRDGAGAAPGGDVGLRPLRADAGGMRQKADEMRALFGGRGECGIPRCRETSLTSREQYCGRKCQLAAWPKHKAECGGRPVQRRKEKAKQKEEF